MERRNNYDIQAAQAKKLFLTYDQQMLIDRCRLRFDERYFYFTFLSQPYRMDRATGDMERFRETAWVDANSFGEVMTVLDWMCDSRADRYITGRWVNLVSQGYSFHRDLQEEKKDPDAALFDSCREAFSAACLALRGEPDTSADLAYAIELVDGLKILVQLWYGDEEFPPRIRCLWDENALRYIRYETTWFAIGLLMDRIKENMPEE